MSKRIILVGPGASGKDYLRKILETKGYRHSISHTTRPIRKGEKNGVDYHFISKNDFLCKIEDGYFYEYNVFLEDWYYGTSIEEFNKSDLLILTPSGIKNLTPEHRKESLVIYLDCDQKIRFKRLFERKDSDDARRRFNADLKDFKNFSDYDLKIDKFHGNELNRIL
jgi:guanylate kinase